MRVTPHPRDEQGHQHKDQTSSLPAQIRHHSARQWQDEKRAGKSQGQKQGDKDSLYLGGGMKSHFSHLWLCDPMDHTPRGSSLHGIFQARILDWVIMPFSRGSSQLRDWTSSLVSLALAGIFFITSVTWEALWKGRVSLRETESDIFTRKTKKIQLL